MQPVLTGPVAGGSSIRKRGATATAVRSKSVRLGPVSGLFPVHATGPLNTSHINCLVGGSYPLPFQRGQILEFGVKGPWPHVGHWYFPLQAGIPASELQLDFSGAVDTRRPCCLKGEDWDLPMVEDLAVEAGWEWPSTEQQQMARWQPVECSVLVHHFGESALG